MRYQRDRSAGMIVFHRGEAGCRYLLVLSRLTKRPLWEFPKGGVDPGETLLDAARRELQEETGLGADAVRLVPGFQEREEYRFTVGKGEDRTLIRKEVTYFLAEALHQEVTVSVKEIREHAWLELPEALRRVRYNGRRRILPTARPAAVLSIDRLNRRSARGAGRRGSGREGRGPGPLLRPARRR